MIQYCVNSLFVHIVSSTDYKSMMSDKTVVENIYKMVVPTSSIGIDLPLEDKYKNYYFSVEKMLKCLI